MNKKKMGKFNYIGTYDAKKTLRILAELYCKQEGYVLEKLIFASDVEKSKVSNAGE